VTTDASGTAPEPQAVIAPLTGAAIFLVVVLNPGEDNAQAVRDLCADIPSAASPVSARPGGTGSPVRTGQRGCIRFAK